MPACIDDYVGIYAAERDIEIYVAGVRMLTQDDRRQGGNYPAFKFAVKARHAVAEILSVALPRSRVSRTCTVPATLRDSRQLPPEVPECVEVRHVLTAPDSTFPRQSVQSALLTRPPGELRIATSGIAS